MTNLSSDRWLITLTGEHDVSTVEDLREKLGAAIRTARMVVLDLSQTTFIDSSTLGALLDADRSASEWRCEYVGVVLLKDSPADRLFGLTGASRLFTTFPSIETALAEFESAPAQDANTVERWQQRKQRIVKNEQTFRDYNDRRLQQEPVDATDDQEQIPFVCECGDQDCVEALVITAADFTGAHSAPNRFLVKPGHVYSDVERVVEERDSFAIVEKHAVLMRQVQ